MNLRCRRPQSTIRAWKNTPNNYDHDWEIAYDESAASHSGADGEPGDPALLRATDSLCAYSGIVPKTYQTSGPDSPATQGHATPRCNRILKDWIVQSARKIQLYGPPELKARITRWNANGQHGIYAAARRYLRLLRSLVKNQIPYLAPSGRDRQATPDERAAAILDTWIRPAPRVKRARQTSQPGKGAKARDARKAPARAPGVRHHPPRPGTVIPAANPRHRPTKPNRPESLSAPARETTPKTKPKKN